LIAGLIEGPWKEALEQAGRSWPEDAFELLPSDADPGAEAWMRANWVVEPAADPRYLDEILPETLSVPLGTWIGVARALRAHDNVERLKRLAPPTLVLWATQDSMFLEADQALLWESLATAPGGAFLKTYGKQPLPPSGMQASELGHNLQWAAPEEVALDLAAFLRDGGAPTPDLHYASPGGARRVATAAGAARILVHERP
jgi:pimeloyl-ACP methyl ester carboxylesterase